jgi:alpha-beta hydrolase superfamily lysophospholipase
MVTGVLLAVLLLPFLLIGGPVAFFCKRKRKAVLRWLAVAYPLAALVVIFGIGPYWLARAIAHAGTRPFDIGLKDTPAEYGLHFEDVTFEAADGIRLRGWIIPPSGKNAIIIGTHGLFRSRVELLSRTARLCEAGYGALLYDSRSHGSSGKAIVSFGFYEKNDVLGAIQFVERRYQDAARRPAIVLMGVSMGAVAVLEAGAASTRYSALVLDSPFSSLKQTIADHTWLFLRLPRFPFANLFLFWFERIAGFDPGLLDSSAGLRKALPVPLLIVASEGDERIPPRAARSLYEEARAPLKMLKMFGAEVPHGAAARLHPQEYNAVLEGFLDKALAEPQPRF